MCAGRPDVQVITNSDNRADHAAAGANGAPSTSSDAPQGLGRSKHRCALTSRAAAAAAPPMSDANGPGQPDTCNHAPPSDHGRYADDREVPCSSILYVKRLLALLTMRL